MSETISPTFTFVKDGVFYFSRRNPKELLRHYSSPRIAYSLRTRSAKIADARARKAADQLDDYWFYLRSQDAEMPGKHMLRQGTSCGAGSPALPNASVSSFVRLSEAVEIYLRQKGKGRPVTFHRAAERAGGYVIGACGDKQLDFYTKADANAFPDALIARGLAGSSQMRAFSNWQWHLKEVFVKIKGEQHYLWRAVDHEGEVLESFVTKTRDRKAALKFIKKSMKRHGSPHILVTDKLRSYGAALKCIGNADKQETGRWLNNRAENSHLPFRRRERAMQRFRSMRSLQKFAAVHSSVCNQFNQERHLYSRANFKLNRAAALAEWRQLCAA